jgi:hypothetical protein
MNLLELQKICNKEFKKEGENGGNVKINNVSVSLLGKTYDIDINLVPDFCLSMINRRPGNRFEIQLSAEHIENDEVFVFVIAHEFGHLEEECKDIINKHKNKEEMNVPVRHWRMTEVEQCADRFAMRTFYSIFGRRFSSAKFLDLLRYNDPTETQDRVSALNNYKI